MISSFFLFFIKHLLEYTIIYTECIMLHVYCVVETHTSQNMFHFYFSLQFQLWYFTRPTIAYMHLCLLYGISGNFFICMHLDQTIIFILYECMNILYLIWTTIFILLPRVYFYVFYFQKFSTSLSHVFNSLAVQMEHWCQQIS